MDVVALGELLIDFTSAGESSGHSAMFERHPGGAPANVAVGCRRLGLRTAFIGKVGNDVHGSFLRKVLEQEGVDCRNLMIDRAAPTPLAFAMLSPDGEREFSFARFHSADTRLTADEPDFALIKSAKILHVGTLSMSAEPSRSATLAALGCAKANGVTVSLDINYRAPLWSGTDKFAAAVCELMPYTDLLKMSEEDLHALGGIGFITELPKFGIITCGAKGAWIVVRDGIALPEEEQTFIPAVKVDDVADTTGAGDAFWAAALYEYITYGQITGELAAKAGAAATQKRGAIPALPTLADLQ
ncbi:MAG: carbohydrate kinase [Oscillospiraceae bacterium]|jgi:fructokinase|nr:carbohydrate kinase [Oscillospiraceae bacterium]